MRRLWILGALLVGCDDGGDSAQQGETPDAAVTDAAPDMAQAAVVPADGLYALGITLAEFGDIQLQSQLEVEMDGATFAAARLRAVGGGEVSEVMGDAAGATVDADGAFRLEFGDIVLPGAFSPTSSDVELNLVLEGSVRAADDLCGGARGNVTTFDTELVASTWGAAPWVDAATPGPGSCDAPMMEDLPRIETCPDLASGWVEDFETGGEARRFYLQIPSDYDAGTMYPLIIAHHGVGGSPDGLNDQADMRSMVDDEGFILVQPQGRELSTAWSSSGLGDNPDLALFDDIVRCVSEQFSVDAARIHSVGHSGGGYYNTFLALRRGEVLASTGGMSPGMTIDYLDPGDKGAMIVGWGGPEDIAFDQDFDVSSKRVMNAFAGNGHFVVACDHSVLPLREDLDYPASRHTWPIDGARWFVRFLLDHPKGAESPYAGGLPDTFPAEVCSIWMAE